MLIKRTILVFILAITAGTFLLSSCNGKSNNQNNQTGSQTNNQNNKNNQGNQNNQQSMQVTVQNSSFKPSTLTVNVGQTVVWKNLDIIDHQIQADDNSFKSPILEKNSTYSFTFNQKGTFTYHCAIHSNMKGTIIVK